VGLRFRGDLEEIWRRFGGDLEEIFASKMGRVLPWI